jgi:hypothetical protein
MTDSSDKLVYERALLVSGGMDGTSARKALQSVREVLSAVALEVFDAGNLSRVINAQIEASQVSSDALIGTLGVAVTGGTEPVDIYLAMEALGKERALRRLEHAIQELMVVA